MRKLITVLVAIFATLYVSAGDGIIEQNKNSRRNLTNDELLAYDSLGAVPAGMTSSPSLYEARQNLRIKRYGLFCKYGFETFDNTQDPVAQLLAFEAKFIDYTASEFASGWQFETNVYDKSGNPSPFKRAPYFPGEVFKAYPLSNDEAVVVDGMTCINIADLAVVEAKLKDFITRNQIPNPNLTASTNGGGTYVPPDSTVVTKNGTVNVYLSNIGNSTNTNCNCGSGSGSSGGSSGGDPGFGSYETFSNGSTVIQQAPPQQVMYQQTAPQIAPQQVVYARQPGTGFRNVATGVGVLAIGAAGLWIANSAHNGKFGTNITQYFNGTGNGGNGGSWDFNPNLPGTYGNGNSTYTNTYSNGYGTGGSGYGTYGN